MYKKCSFSLRIQAVQLCLSGISSQAVGKRLNINPNYIREWLSRYSHYGIEGLKYHPNIFHSFEEKCKIICEYRKKQLPLHEISAIYTVSQSQVFAWNRIVNIYGYDGLRVIKSRDLPKSPNTQQHKPPIIMGRPKKQEPQTELEKLQRENEYLRAENAYLKKLRALVLEKEARKQRSEF